MTRSVLNRIQNLVPISLINLEPQYDHRDQRMTKLVFLRVQNFQTSPRMSEVEMEVEGEGGEGVVVDALPYIDHG